MEENEDEPEDVRKSTPVDIEIRAGEKDETAGDLQSGAKKTKHKSPSCDVTSRRKNKVENQLVKFEALCCRGRNNTPFKPPKSMSVFIYSPLCSLPKLEIIPRHCLSKKEYIDMLATASRKCPPPCCGKSVLRRIRPVSARMNELAQPARRQVMATLQDRGESLPAQMIDNLVKTMEENSCLTPEQAEDYFRDKNPRKCRRSARRSRKSKRQSRKQETCGSQLNKESVTNQYLMAERLVKSILQWRCSIPTEDFQDIADVILRRLSLTLEYDPTDDKDLRSQQMRFLADVIACWISGVLFEVSEDHRKEIEEEWRQRQLEAERNREEEEISVTIDFGDPPGGSKDKDSDEGDSSEDGKSRGGKKSGGREERRDKSRKWRKKGGRWEKDALRKGWKSSESVGSPMEEAAESSKRESEDDGEESSRKSEERRTRKKEERENRRRDRALEKERARKREERRKREEEEAERERKRERRRKEKEERRIKEAEARRKRREAEKKRREDEKKKEQEEEERKKKEEEEEKRKRDEEEEKKRKEEEEVRLREEEEKRKKEEEEKKKQEEEERRRKEEEERKKKEEEEAKRKEEEEKKRREEEEKLKVEAAKKQKEEEDRKREERERKAEEEKKLKEAEKKRRREEEEKRKRGRVKRRKEAGERETRGDRSGTYGSVLDTIYNVLDELPAKRVETDPVQNRIQRAIYEKVLRRVESENPAAVDENFKDVVDVVASKAAAWLKEVLVDAGLRLDRRSVRGVRSVEIREWAKWVDEVTEKANDWADWIHKLVEDAEEKSTEQVNRGEWYDWTSEAETDALLWRRYYLETTQQAYRNEMTMAGRPVAKTGNETQPENPLEMEIPATVL